MPVVDGVTGRTALDPVENLEDVVVLSHGSAVCLPLHEDDEALEAFRAQNLVRAVHGQREVEVRAV